MKNLSILFIFLISWSSAFSQCDFVAWVDSSADVSCYGFADGYIRVDVSGGYPPYEFLWSNNDITPFADSLITGVYYLYLSDSTSCENIIEFNITEPDPLIYNLNKVADIYCGEGNGLVTLKCEGGLPPYFYSVDDDGWVLFSDSTDISLDSGLHYIEIKDRGCYELDSVNINYTDGIDLIKGTVIKVSCFGYNDGSFQIDITGGTPPFKIIVTEELTDLVFSVEQHERELIINHLRHGFYRVNVSDIHNCNNTITIPIYQPDSTSIYISVKQEYVIFGDSIMIYKDSSHTINGPVSYIWEPEIGLGCTNCPSPNASPPSDAIYIVKMVDSHNCIAVDTVKINVVLDELFLPNAFTPNNDGRNDIFRVIGFLEEISFFEMQIFSRWGTLIEEIKDPYRGWDGTHNGKLCAPGVYVWKVTYESNESPLFPGTKMKVGTVTLLN